MTASAAIVSGLIGGAALGTSAPNKSISEEHAHLRIIKLFDIALADQASFANGAPELFTKSMVLRAMRTAVIVELNIEAGKIALVCLLHLGDEFFLADTCLAGANHDRRTVRVVGTHVHAAIAN